IYYDQVSDDQDFTARNGALAVQNLLGHFPQYQQYIAPISTYKKGDIDRCNATIYISSNDYGQNDKAKLPKDFQQDFINTKKNVVWLGYNIQNLGAANLKKLWNVRYDGIAHHTNKKGTLPTASLGAYSYKG